jgi:hypothetical protein
MTMTIKNGRICLDLQKRVLKQDCCRFESVQICSYLELLDKNVGLRGTLRCYSTLPLLVYSRST